MMTLQKRSFFERFDFSLFCAVLLISVIGLLNLNSATSSFPEKAMSQFVWNQIFYSVFGIMLMVMISFLKIKHFLMAAPAIYVLSLISLVLVLIMGSEIKGSQSWINLGFVNVQPSEFAKLALILFLSRHFAMRANAEPLGLRELIVPVLIFLGPVILIVLQGDLGTSLFFGFIFLSMVMIQGLPWRWVFSALLLVVGVSVLAYSFWLKPYQKMRILSFMDPELDARGSGYHLVQSKIAVGSGQILGRGYLKGESNKLKYLPERHTDFVFPVLAQEWGFVGSVSTLALYFCWLMLCVRALSHTQDSFAFFAGFGILSLYFWHLVINLCGVLGLMPLTGVPLPLFSYGGSSLLTAWIGIGVMNVIYRDRFRQ